MAPPEASGSAAPLPPADSDAYVDRDLGEEFIEQAVNSSGSGGGAVAAAASRRPRGSPRRSMSAEAW